MIWRLAWVSTLLTRGSGEGLGHQRFLPPHPCGCHSSILRTTCNRLYFPPVLQRITRDAHIFLAPSLLLLLLLAGVPVLHDTPPLLWGRGTGGRSSGATERDIPLRTGIYGTGRVAMEHICGDTGHLVATRRVVHMSRNDARSYIKWSGRRWEGVTWKRR